MNAASGWGRLAGLIVTCLMAGIAGTASAADIFKWVDENGVTHYSNIKPSGVKWERVTGGGISIIPGNRIGAEAARAAQRAGVANAPRETVSAQDTAVAVNQILADQARAWADRRQRMIQECQANNGTDCEREVDTELRAEGIQQQGGVIRLSPPALTVPIPSPNTSPASPASALR